MFRIGKFLKRLTQTLSDDQTLAHGRSLNILGEQSFCKCLPDILRLAFEQTPKSIQRIYNRIIYSHRIHVITF